MLTHNQLLFDSLFLIVSSQFIVVFTFSTADNTNRSIEFKKPYNIILTIYGEDMLHTHHIRRRHVLVVTERVEVHSDRQVQVVGAEPARGCNLIITIFLLTRI